MENGIMKKCLGWLAACALVFGMAPEVRAYTETVDGVEWSYRVDNGLATVIGVEPAEGSLTIPSELGGYPVAAAPLDSDEDAFYDIESLTITISDAVTSIGEYAFERSALTSVSIPESVTNIGRWAFSKTILTSVNIPASVTTIGRGAFSDTFLSSAIIPEGVTSIEDDVFSECWDLTSVSIPDSVTSIGSYVFSYCESLETLSIPESVTNIGSYVFYGCESLKSLSIPDSVTSIGSYVFYGCESLATLSVPGAWKDSDMLADADVPEGCTVVYRKPVITTAALPAATELVPYETSLVASGGTAPYSWTAIGEGYEEMTLANSFAASGTAQGWQTDDTCWELELPFAFPFFGQSYDRCYVADNGTICFGGYFSQYWFNQSSFLAQPMLAAMWADLYGDGMDIWVASGTDSITIRWMSRYYYNSGEVNFSATLKADGTIMLAYGDGNANGGYVGISAGDGQTAVYSAKSNSGSLDHADNIIFKPLGLPEEFELTSAGVLQGTPQEAGSFSFTAVVSDASGATASRPLTLEVAENPAIRPALASTSPQQGYVNLKTATSKKLWVKATHPAGGTLSYAWSVDGAAVSGTKTNFTYRKTDTALHTVRCTVSGADLPRTAVAEWKLGVLTVDGPEDVSLSYGQGTVLRAEMASSLPATVTWYDGNGGQVGSGETLNLENMQATSSYYPVAASTMGTVTGRTATVTVDPRPSVGRIYKLTGAPFAGNRLVLRAKPYGNLEGAAYSWKCDGREVATTERLDIASLGAGDFGTYTLTVTTPLGTATSEGYVLSPAPAGVPETWGNDSLACAPGGVSGMVQVAGGYGINAALLSDGTVSVWGDDQGSGACTVPEGLSGVSRLAVGGTWNREAVFAVKTDGSIASWGRSYSTETYWNDYAHSEYDPETGQWTYTGDWITYTNGVDFAGSMPEEVSNVVKVVAGQNWALALAADGRVFGWGAEYMQWQMAIPEGLSDVVDIALGDQFALALTADGAVVAWGNSFFGATAVPDDAFPAVAVETAGSVAGVALLADGTLRAWGDNQNWYGLVDVPVSGSAFTDLAAGQAWAAALDAAGNVHVWGSAWGLDEDNIPTYVQGAALGIAAGNSHCTALLADTDGDSIADVLEPRYGRDPAVWEPWERVTLGGNVTVAGGTPSGSVALALIDAEGEEIGWTVADGTGAWSIEGVLPGVYSVQVAAAGAVDVGVGNVSLLGGSASVGLDFDLEPGEGEARAEVVAHLSGDGDIRREKQCSAVDLPQGTAAYLDMWPVQLDADGTLGLGEVSGRISDFDGTLLMQHAVTVRLPGTDGQTPAPAWLGGREGETVQANPHFTEAAGSVRIETRPAGAQVWVDYADVPLGVTPLTVSGLSAVASHSHTLLLKKDGCLRPRPIQFQVEPGATTAIDVPLATNTAPAMTVAVDSAIGGMDIYVDYLPAARVTPATVDDLDPASHAGSLWYSASHSILLKHARLRPFAPRAVPEERVLDEASGEWQLVLDTALSITAPNTWDGMDAEQTVTFNANGGTCATASDTYVVGKPYGALPVPKKGGYAFTGWFTAAKGGDLVTEATLVSAETARTLWAQWTDKQVTTFAGNGGTPEIQTTTNAIYATYGVFPGVERENHVFLGWFNAPEGGKRIYTNSTVTLAAARTLYAQWTDQQATTFKGNGGTPATKVATNTMGTAYGPMPVPKRSGFAFLGWFTAAEGGTAVTEQDTVTLATARTLYAHWTDRQTTFFLGNGGTPEIQSTTNTIYGDYGVLPAAKRSGHVLAGWFTAPEGGKRIYTNSTVTLAATRTLYAQWTDQQVATFKGNGGTPASQKATYTIYAKYGAFPSVAWSNHVFLGWFNDPSEGKQVYTNSTVTLAAARTLYAHWSDRQATTFKGNGGTPETQTATNTIGEAYGTLPVPKLPGHVFLGWFTAADGGTAVTAADMVTEETARTLYAHWTDRQTTVFKGNGGSPATQTTTNTIYADYGELPAAKRSGYALVGWFNAPEGGKRVYTNSTVTFAATRTLYAQWTDRQVTTFKGNGGTPATQKTTNTIYAKYGAFPSVSWSNHVFLGWFNESSGKQVYTNSTVTLAATRTLHAHWTDKQVTTFNGNGGTPATKVATNTIGSAYGTLPVPKLSGHVFLGWFTAAEGGTAVADADAVTPETKRTLYAHWTDQQVTTFMGNGGSPATQTTTNTIYADYGELPAAKRSGYALVGWFNAPEGGKRVYTNSAVTFAATRTLYAQWTDKQVTTFKGNGGTPATQKTTNTIYASYGTMPAATREGYTFLGWFNAQEGGKRVYTNSTVTLAATRTLYAHWAASKSLFMITGMETEAAPGSGGIAARSPLAAGKNPVAIRFAAVGGVEYEIQWTPSLAAEWTPLQRWQADSDGEADVQVTLPGGASSGFFRVLAIGPLPDGGE